MGVGLVAAAGGLIRLPRVIAYGVAMRVCLTGEPLDFDAAAQFGLVAEIAEDDDALEAVAHRLATRIAANAPLAVAASKRVVRASWALELDEAFTAQSATTDPVFASEDAREGATSFVERRAPVWSGR